MSGFNSATAAEVIGQAFPPFIASFNLKLEELSEGRIVMCLPFNPNMSRIGGVISGQALAAFADTTMVCALWSSFGEQKSVATVDLHVTYMRTAKEEDLLAIADVVKVGRSLCFAEVAIVSRANREKPVAKAVGTFAIAGG